MMPSFTLVANKPYINSKAAVSFYSPSQMFVLKFFKMEKGHLSIYQPSWTVTHMLRFEGIIATYGHIKLTEITTAFILANLHYGSSLLIVN